MKEGQEAAYAAYKATLTDSKVLEEAIYYNWRVELWGEGYGLQTFRRRGVTVEIGDNHLRANKDPLNPNTERVYTYEIPSSEMNYNPYISTTEMAVKVNRR